MEATKTARARANSNPAPPKSFSARMETALDRLARIVSLQDKAAEVEKGKERSCGEGDDGHTRSQK